MPLRSRLQDRREDLLRLARRHGVATIRLFGSAARGEDTAESDLDLLVKMEPGRSLLDLIEFEQDCEDLLGVPVDVLTEGSLHPLLRDTVLSEAVPV